jgi:diadenylate cyclase
MNPFERFQVLNPDWHDMLEIAIVAFIMYRVLLLFHGTRAVQMAVGIVLLFAAYAAAWVLKLGMITYLLGLVFTYGAFALLVVFQPELRAALAHLGRSRLTRVFQQMDNDLIADSLLDAAERLSRARIGAIIALERAVPLGDIVATGSAMQAKVSADLLLTIFTPYSPLHDGAVIVRGDTIVGAGCILPLTQSDLSDRSLGTRHRAALGLSEDTDALVIVVSEESGAVSVAARGRLRRDLTPAQLREVLGGRWRRTTDIPAVQSPA